MRKGKRSISLILAWPPGFFGIMEQGQIAFHAQRGALCENMVVTEFLKGRFNRGQQAADLHFWRDSKGLEMDLLLDDGINLTPVEIKSGQTIAADSHIAPRKWCELSGTTDRPALLANRGDKGLTNGNIAFIPGRKLERSCDFGFP